MNPSFSAEVARFQSWMPWALDKRIEEMDANLKELQSQLAAARKAQKNQKRAAKERKKVVE